MKSGSKRLLFGPAFRTRKETLLVDDYLLSSALTRPASLPPSMVFAGKRGTSGFDDATHVLGASRVHFCHGVGDGFGVVLVAGGRRQEGFQEIGLGGFGSGLVRQSLVFVQFGGLTTGLDALLDDLEHFLVGRFVTVGDLQVLDVRQRQVDRVELGLVLGFHRRDLGFLQRVLHRHVRSSFLDRSNTVLILRVYQSAVLYPCRRHPRRSQAHETLGAMTTVIMRTSHDTRGRLFLALFQGFRFLGNMPITLVLHEAPTGTQE